MKWCFSFIFQVRTLFVSGLPMDAKPRELYLLFRAYEVSFPVYSFLRCHCFAEKCFLFFASYIFLLFMIILALKIYRFKYYSTWRIVHHFIVSQNVKMYTKLFKKVIFYFKSSFATFCCQKTQYKRNHFTSIFSLSIFIGLRGIIIESNKQKW